ncbi:SDR family NAD(P)-dependent oxidoreductase [Edaphobacter albus]|uniref:SDR family NAD(P)-dependent oxidoreductase n=1 Tax=Edaphobacter sp. 4G125 TaxID=2763071 RepID=UPI00164802F1|nr:glucose 1-dehydrogenase [Edaphobacter sp. 4G125]QNI38186.1 glucose 1-dehydrogenase [Edaphobacter sp. 4G125]
MSGSLSGKCVVVTGGAQGIGLECARAYVREGAQVAILDLSIEQGERAAVMLGPVALFVHCDISSSSSVEKAVSVVLAALGKVDALHNNAGVAMPSKPLHETDEAEWDRLFGVNLKSVLWTTRYFYKELLSTRGTILNTASMVGLIGQANHAAYVATKGALISLTKAMALDYAADGIRVNAICPAGVWTPMLRQWAAEQENEADIASYLDRIHPLGSCPEGDVIADAAVFLLSDAARFITGCALPVSGGAELGYRL